MGNFLKSIRNSKIDHPTNENFSIVKWEQAFNSFATEKNDYEIFKLGCWIAIKRKGKGVKYPDDPTFIKQITYLILMGKY